MKKRLLLPLLILLGVTTPVFAAMLSSSNIPLDSPIYLYLEKLAGFGLLKSDIKGLRPYSKAEAARLLLEAEKHASTSTPLFARELMTRLRELLPREVQLQSKPELKPQLIDYLPVSYVKARYVYLDGMPRDYNRRAVDPGDQGFLGIGNLHKLPPSVVTTRGTEGTPLLENNEGLSYGRGQNGDIRLGMEGYLSRYATLAVEPLLLVGQNRAQARLQKGYLKVGGGGLELEIGRDANWYGPGYRGTLSMTNNAQNFDQIKLWSPEPVDAGWVNRYLGTLKYSVLATRFEKTGSGLSERQPYSYVLKLSVMPKDWFEYGFTYMRQFGGPLGNRPQQSVWSQLFGIGGTNSDTTNTMAGFDLRFRIPQLRNTEVYWEYSGDDNYGPLPIIDSHVAGFYIPCLTESCRDDLRFEYFWGGPQLYASGTYPNGYVYRGMTPGHSQGTAAQEFFTRYSHWFGVRNNLALEYFYTARGRTYRVAAQAMEEKHAGRIAWTLPVWGDIDAQANYGIERINNLNLVNGVTRTNQLLRLELRYRY